MAGLGCSDHPPGQEREVASAQCTPFGAREPVAAAAAAFDVDHGHLGIPLPGEHGRPLCFERLNTPVPDGERAGLRPSRHAVREYRSRSLIPKVLWQ